MILPREKLIGLLEQYPPERRYALAVFQDVQSHCGYLPKEHITDAAAYLGVPLSQAFAMATFYNALSLEPRGKYVIRVCDGTACHIRGSLNTLDSLKRLIGLSPGETDEEGLFTVETVACLGACALSPVMQIGDEYFGNLDDGKISGIVAGLREKEAG